MCDSVRVNPTCTMADVFMAYRVCNMLLARDVIPHGTPVVKRGFARAMDPSLIRIVRVYGGAPRGLGGDMTLSDKERTWLDFVHWVDYRVSRLRPLPREVIEIRYLGEKVRSLQEVLYILESCGRRIEFFELEQAEREGLDYLATHLLFGNSREA